MSPDLNQRLARQFAHAYVAVSPRGGHMISLILPWLEASLMSPFPSHTTAHYPGERCEMLMDRAGTSPTNWRSSRG